MQSWSYMWRQPWRALPVVALAVSGCQCDPDQVVSCSSELSAEPPRIDLGRIFIGDTIDASFTVRTVGCLPVEASAGARGNTEGIVGIGPPSAWAPNSLTLRQNAPVDMLVRLRPQIPGVRSFFVVLNHNASENGPQLEVEVRMEVILPPDCEDGNGCTRDTFDPETGRCIREATTDPCTTFNPCLQNEACVEGMCLGEAVSCDDDNPCTDDVCDPFQGCLNLPTRTCDDGNPCTADSCDPDGGCQFDDLPDGTPCDDFEQCTIADICLFGSCRGVAIPDGSECDDGNPCTDMDQCIEGTCEDPTFTPPGIGDISFMTMTSTLVPGTSRNPIVDQESTVFLGTEEGMTAVDQCGEILWTNDTLGAPRFEAAVSLPGIVTVPIGARLYGVDAIDGTIFDEIDLSSLVSTSSTSSTATVTPDIRILDVAVRGSTALVVSVFSEPEPGVYEGFLAEVDPTRQTVTRFRDLGDLHASRLAIDLDEAVVTVLSEGHPDDPVREHRLVRFGLENLPGTTWSSDPVSGLTTDLALGADGEVWWTAGLTKVDKNGVPTLLVPAPLDPERVHAGAPVLGSTQLYTVVRIDSLEPLSLPDAPGGAFHLMAFDRESGTLEFDIPLPGRAVQMSPVVDLSDNVFVLIDDGTIVGFDPNGELVMQTNLPLEEIDLESVTLTLNARRVLVVASKDRLIGVQSYAPLGFSSWPRHRRDNFSTGHR